LSGYKVTTFRAKNFVWLDQEVKENSDKYTRLKR